MSTTRTNADLKELVSQATSRGLISAGSATSLQAADIGQVIRAGLGVDADSFESSEAYLSICDLDDSGSIRMAGNAPHVRAGANLLKQSLLESASRDEVLHLLKTINGEIIYPFGPLSGAPDLTPQNYDPMKGTPLYDSVIASCGLLLTKAHEFERIGAPCRGALLIVSDGADLNSRHSVGDVRRVVEDVLRREQFLVIFMGIDDGSTDFRAIAEAMGIRPEWVLTPKNSASEIRRAFQTASRASKAASQGAASFSKTAAAGLGGFAIT